MIESLPWDTEHFGFPIARAGAGVTAAELDEADRNGTRCIYLLVDTGYPEAIRGAEELGFRVIDVRITLTMPAAPAADQGSAHPIRLGVPDDLPALEELASTAHEDSRFFSDPGFDRAAAGRLYRRWMRASLLEGFADLVLVAENDGRAGGYITSRRTDDVVDIGLLAVAESLRGRGVGRSLVAGLVDHAYRRGARTVSVVTQGRNRNSQRLYQAVGFRTSRTELWLHRWASPAESLR